MFQIHDNSLLSVATRLDDKGFQLLDLPWLFRFKENLRFTYNVLKITNIEAIALQNRIEHLQSNNQTFARRLSKTIPKQTVAVSE